MKKDPDNLDFDKIWKDVKKHRRLYCVVLAVTFVVSVIILQGIPDYYRCTVKLAPEFNDSKNSSVISGVANSLGISLGNSASGTDALFPTLYPDLMNSVAFKASLFSVKVKREEDKAPITYYDYLLNHQKAPWWNSFIHSLCSLFSCEKTTTKKNIVNPFRLTPEQSGVIGVMNSKVVCDVDKRTMVISINVTDQDPLVAATMADSVQLHLQEFITQYRTKKARVDLAYNKKLYAEAKVRYDKARKNYAYFSDANQRVFLESILSKKQALEHEMQLQYSAYSQISAQLMAAEAKVQQETPAFTDLQPATVPLSKAGPNRERSCLLLLFLAFIATTIWVLYREGHLLYLLGLDNTEESDEDEIMESPVRIASKTAERPSKRPFHIKLKPDL